jgi:nucleoside-diphosphate-sugar epimerase
VQTNSSENGMKVMVTGHDGYIGRVLVPLLEERGYEVHGVDSGLFRGCALGPDVTEPSGSKQDVRDLEASDLKGFDAVMHLAAVSNDPIGDLNPSCTYEINHEASVRTAELAKEAGVTRFLFSSSCSLYGAAAGQDALDETASFNPVTAYGESKVLAEEGIRELADDQFSPIFLRNATAYGVSERQRGDLVVNNLVGLALTTGEVRLNSDGTAWRPLVHIEDISRALIAALEAPRESVHNEAFNVGRDEDNYRIRDVAALVEELVPGTRVTLAEGAGTDKRSYRVSFEKVHEVLPAFDPRWTVRRGVQELVDAFRSEGLSYDDFMSSRFQRIRRIRELQDEGRIDADLRWREPALASQSS